MKANPLFDKQKLFEAAQKVEEPGPGESIAAGEPPRREPCTGCGGHGFRWERLQDDPNGNLSSALMGCPVCSDRGKNRG